jgi:hypothetical protein
VTVTVVIKFRCFLFSSSFVDIRGISLKCVVQVVVEENIKLMDIVITDMKNRTPLYQCPESCTHNVNYTSLAINIIVAAFDVMLEVFAFELTILNIYVECVSNAV